MHQILKQYMKVVSFLGKILGPDYEIVLHDLTEGNYTVVAIENGFNSNRSIGSPLTQKALSFIKDGVYKTSDYQIGYRGLTQDQKETISSTMFIKDTDETLIGMLCINYNTEHGKNILRDISDLLNLPDTQMIKTKATDSSSNTSTLQESTSKKEHDFSTNLNQPAYAPSNDAIPQTFQNIPENSSKAMNIESKTTNSTHSSKTSLTEIPEIFSSSLEDLISEIMKDTIPPDTPVDRLNQNEKIEVVHKLKENGVFSIKGSVREVAKYLNCSEPTIYRYLKAL